MTEQEQPAVPSGSQVFAPSVGMRTYFSSHQLWAAHHFAALAREIEDAPRDKPKFSVRHRAYVSGAVLASCAFLEAAINEVLQDAADDYLSYIGDLPAETRRALAIYWQESNGMDQPLSKYQIVLGIAHYEPLEKGAEPYQSAKLLIDIRNRLVHFRPTTANADHDGKFAQGLRAHFDENKLAGSGNPFWPNRCLGATCAEWAAASAKTFADAAFSRLKIKPNYQRVTWPPDDGASVPLPERSDE
jgi:hypothetical protein